MGTNLFSERMKEYLVQYGGIDAQTKMEITTGTIDVVGKFFYELSVPNSWYLKDIKRVDNDTLIFYWGSNTEQAVCTKCKTNSYNRTKKYDKRLIQDLPA